MDVSEAIRLYTAGLSLRAVGSRLGGYDPRSVSFQLERAGIPRRAWDPRTGGAKYQPRVRVECAFCRRPLMMRQYYFRNGNGTNAHPNPPAVRFHRRCLALARRALGIRPGDPFFPIIWAGLYGQKLDESAT